MRNHPVLFLSRVVLTLAVVSAAGCGGTEQQTFVCDPPCGAGMHCAESGCVPDSPGSEPDLSVLVADMAGTCPSECGGATPYCGPNQTCVPCLTDAHCPVGSYCK